MKKTLEGLIKFKQNDLMMMIDDGMATNDYAVRKRLLQG